METESVRLAGVAVGGGGGAKAPPQVPLLNFNEASNISRARHHMWSCSKSFAPMWLVAKMRFTSGSAVAMRGAGVAGRGVSRGGYKHPQVLHKCALLSPSPRAPSYPLWPPHTTNSTDALRLRNLRAATAAVGDAPLGCSNESSSTSSSGNSSSNDSNSCYLLVARLAWLGLTRWVSLYYY